MAPPTAIFGSASFGSSYKTVSEVAEVVQVAQAAAIRRIDTAARYGNNDSERLIGEAGLSKNFDIDTKIWVGSADGSGSLTPTAIEKSLVASLQRLKVTHVCYPSVYPYFKQLKLSRSIFSIAILLIPKHHSWSKQLLLTLTSRKEDLSM